MDTEIERKILTDEEKKEIKLKLGAIWNDGWYQGEIQPEGEESQLFKYGEETLKLFESLIAKKMGEARRLEREEIKSIIIKRTEVPKGARNPVRDATVMLGEELCNLIDYHLNSQESQNAGHTKKVST